MKTLQNFAKILSLMLVVSAIFVLASCNFGGALKMTAFTVDRSSVKTVYYIGEEIDFSGIRASVQYSDKTLNVEYTAKDLTVTYDPDITATAGTKSVTVSFMDPHLNVKQEAKVQITVKEDPNAIKHASYAVDFSGMKTTYFVGEALDFTGVKIIEKFTNGGTDVEITDLTSIAYDYASDLTATAGTKTVTVTFGGESAGVITVTVKKQDNAGDDIVNTTIGGTYNTTYRVGESVDFSNLTVTLAYQSGDTLTLSQNDLTFSAVDTSTPGEKTIIISFNDPKDTEVSHSLPLIITVVKAKPTITQFENSSDLSAFYSDNQSAGKTEYGKPGFSGEFLKGGVLYVIGDDNAFYLNPAFSTMDDLGAITSSKEFYSLVTVSMWKDGAYVELDARRGANASTYDYFDGNEKIVTVNTYEGEYLFYKPLEKVKISVLPDAEFYQGVEDLAPVVLEAKVIDAYNVYSAKELSLIHNTDDYKNEWETFRQANGLSMIDVNALAGIVLHKDIHISKSDVPAELFYITDNAITYHNSVTQELHTVPAGTAYLKDDVQIYRRVGAGDFVIEGNLFNLDVKNFPLVASPAVFGSNAGKDYGSDYSNSALFLFEWSASEYYVTSAPAEVPDITISNVGFVGNAARDNWVDANDGLVTAGGLILYKSARWANTTFNNCIKNSFFISYMSEFGATFTINDSKCYDSYQNAAFVFAHATLTINDSFINGTGGPVIIAQSDQYPQNSGTYYSPITNVNNTKTDTALTGREVWFVSTGATTLISGITALSDGLQAYYQFPASLTKDGKLNIIAALMPNADSAEELADGMIEGTVLIDGKGTERWLTNPDWLAILMSSYFQAGKYCLSTTDSNGVTHTIVADTSTGLDLYDLAGNRILPGSEAFAPFASANQIVLHYGGLSVIFELYH